MAINPQIPLMATHAVPEKTFLGRISDVAALKDRQIQAAQNQQIGQQNIALNQAKLDAIPAEQQAAKQKVHAQYLSDAAAWLKSVPVEKRSGYWGGILKDAESKGIDVSQLSQLEPDDNTLNQLLSTGMGAQSFMTMQNTQAQNKITNDRQAAIDAQKQADDDAKKQADAAAKLAKEQAENDVNNRVADWLNQRSLDATPTNIWKARQDLEYTASQRADDERAQQTFEETKRHNAAMEKAQATRAAAGGGGGFGGNASKDDAKAVAQAIIRGEQSPVLSGATTGNKIAIQAELARNGYNQALAEQDYRAVTKHLATLNGAQQERLRQAITFTYDSVDNIDTLYTEWKKLAGVSGYKVLNKANLEATKQLPGKAGAAAQALEAQIADLTSELGTVYKGGNSSTDHSLELASKNLEANWNEETFTKAIQQIRKNLTIRRNSMLASEAAGVSAGSPYVVPTPPPAEPAPNVIKYDSRGNRIQ